MRSSEYREGYDKGYNEGYEKALQEARHAIDKIPHRSALYNDPKNWPVNCLTFGTRIENSFKRASISTLGDLTEWTADRLLRLDGFGIKSVVRVSEQLSHYGLSLKGQLQKQYQPDDQELNGAELTKESSEHPPIYTVLTLDERIKNCFAHANIRTLEQLQTYSPEKLLKIRNFGPDSLRKVKQELSDLSLSLADEQ